MRAKVSKKINILIPDQLAESLQRDPRYYASASSSDTVFQQNQSFIKSRNSKRIKKRLWNRLNRIEREKISAGLRPLIGK